MRRRSSSTVIVGLGARWRDGLGQLAADQAVRGAAEHRADLVVVAAGLAQRSEAEELVVELVAVGEIRREQHLLGPHLGEQAQQVEGPERGGVEEDVGHAVREARDRALVGDRRVRQDQARLGMRVAATAASSAPRPGGRPRPAWIRTGRRRSAASAKTASKRGSATENACERGCSLMPRAPRSMQRSASASGSSPSSASRTNGISRPSLSAAQAGRDRSARDRRGSAPDR